MKKRSLIVILAVLCIATSCFVSSTFAKFTSTNTGSAVAKVADWSWSGTATATNFEVDLADTIKDSDGTSTETDVADDVIAPGTSGTFQLTVKNDSEVNGKVSFVVTPDAQLPFTFSYAWVNDNGTANGTNLTNIDVAMGETVTLTVSWVWEFIDTAENDLAGEDLTTNISVTMEQVD